MVNTATVTSDQTGPLAGSVTAAWQNVALGATLCNDGPVVEGGTATVTFSGQTEPSTADSSAGFTYSYDFDNDGTFEISASSLAAIAVPATYLTGVSSRTVRGRIADKDGGVNDYTTVITVTQPTPTSTPSGSGTPTPSGSATPTGSTTDPLRLWLPGIFGKMIGQVSSLQPRGDGDHGIWLPSVRDRNTYN